MVTSVTDDIFDVIIAGAGPAGCVLAGRLSEDPKKKILLLEAGPDAPPGAEHPDTLDPFPVSASNPLFSWLGLVFETETDTEGGAARAPLPYLQGYGVGGGSNINGMGADRGIPADYDEWHTLGAEGWAWKDVLPYFKRLERDLDSTDADDSSVHGYTGPLPIRRLPRAKWAPFASALGNALQRRGMPYIEDYNADFREGFGAAPTNCLPTRRMSASMAYLTCEVRGRPNLTLLPNTRVDRLEIRQRRATGAFVYVGGTTKLFRGRLVICACGALQTPALLMRSGIGPAAHLTAHGIATIANLPGVGANLQNHPYIILATYLPAHARQDRNHPWLLQNWARFSSNHPSCPQNDMHMMPFNRCDWHELGRRIGALTIAVFKPYSKGRIELSNAAAGAMPKIYFNLLSDSRDRDRLVEGVRFALELLIDPEVRSLHEEIFFPDSSIASRLSRRNSRNRIGAWLLAQALGNGPLRRNALSRTLVDPKELLANAQTLQSFVGAHAAPEYHVCGTCRLGSSDDPYTVVDSRARVRGIDALRIGDASVFPTVPRANTHLTVLMTAEKIADMVKSDWQ